MCVLLGQCTGAVISLHRRKVYFVAGLVVWKCVEFHYKLVHRFGVISEGG